MTLHQLKVFSKVAKLRSFTLAAAGLDVSQPSVSFVVQSLERELKVKLFEKLGNKIRPTEPGRRLLRRAENIIAGIEAIQEEMDEIKGLKKGRLSVGGSSLAAASFLPVAIQKFKEERPGIEMSMRVQRSGSLEKKLLEGELDVAILGLPCRSPMLVAEPYRDEEILVVASPKHPLTKRRSAPLELIAKEPLITEEKGSFIRQMIERKFVERKLPFIPALEVELGVGNRETIKSAVAGNLGIGFLSKCYVIGDIKAERLKVINVPELKLKRTTYIAVPKRGQSSPLVRAFIEFLKRHKEWP